MKHDKGLVLIAISPQKLRQLLADSALRRRDVYYLAPMLKRPADLKAIVEVAGGADHGDPWSNAEV